MLRPGAQVEAPSLFNSVGANCRVAIDVEAFLDGPSDADERPPHQALDGRVRPCFQNLGQLGQLFLRKP